MENTPKANNDTLRRLKKITNCKSDKDLAILIGLKPSNFSLRKQRGTLLSELVNFAIRTNIDLNLLLRGHIDEKTNLSKSLAENSSNEKPTHPPNEIQTNTSRFVDPIIEDIEMWLKEMRGEEPEISSWFKIELKKKFPEFKEWCERKERKENEENNVPEGPSLNIA